MYFSYVPRLVDFVADSDVESLVLALLPRICWPPREPDTEGWHSQRERSSRTSNTAFEGLDFLKKASRVVFLSKYVQCSMRHTLCSWKGTPSKIKGWIMKFMKIFHENLELYGMFSVLLKNVAQSFLWIISSGTWAWTISVVPVVWRPWLTLFPLISASRYMFFNFVGKVLFPVGTLENHDIVGVVGFFFCGGYK